jgi:hypothetical protein
MTNELKEMLVFLMIISVTAFALVECNGQARKIECQTGAFKAGVDAKVCQ